MTQPADPLPGYSFLVEIDDIVEAGFTACSGLNAKREVWTNQEGGLNDYTHTRLGRITYANITLKQGVVFSNKLWEWFEKGGEYLPPQKRKKISIIQCVPYAGTRVRQYELADALPVAWTGPELNTNSNEVAIESLEIAISRFSITQIAQQ